MNVQYQEGVCEGPYTLFRGRSVKLIRLCLLFELILTTVVCTEEILELVW